MLNKYFIVLNDKCELIAYTKFAFLILTNGFWCYINILYNKFCIVEWNFVSLVIFN